MGVAAAAARGAGVTTLYQWAAEWRVPLAAVADLQRRIGLDVPTGAVGGESEAAAQTRVRLEGARMGLPLWRNNVGTLLDTRGVPVRFGLANDSAAVNERVKSADLIGIRPLVITPALVGATVGQFVSREVKAPGWKYAATPREVAQLKWAELVLSLGGDAAFCTGEGTL